MAKLTAVKRERLPASLYACPIDRKLPINDAAHVRNAMARLDQVISATVTPQKQEGGYWLQPRSTA
jgi:hypothetical protein